MRTLLVALVVTGSLLAVSVAPAAAITKSYVKDNVHTFVGLIGFYDADWNWQHRCTGELRPTTKPSITGSDRNAVMTPRRATLATRKTRPVTSTNAVA